MKGEESIKLLLVILIFGAYWHCIFKKKKNMSIYAFIMILSVKKLKLSVCTILYF